MCVIQGIRTAAGSAAATARSLAGERWWHCGTGDSAGGVFQTDKWLLGCESSVRRKGHN